MKSEHMLQNRPVTQETQDLQQAASYLSGELRMQAGKRAEITVGQVIEHVKAWVDMQGEQMPGFLGAHLMVRK